VLADRLADRVPPAFWQYLAEARALRDLRLSVRSCAASPHDGPAAAGVPRLIAGLAGLTRLRTLALKLDNVCEDATLPACLSRLAGLTSLHLSGLRGLRCAPGWARLPALACLVFEECVFAADGEEALPGMDALGALTSLALWDCPSLRALPASLWRLSRLRSLRHWSSGADAARPPRREAPVSGLPAGGAPCLGAVRSFALSCHGLPAFPPCVLAMARLAHLDLAHCGFERLPGGVSALTALEALRLGRRPGEAGQVGGSFDARALGGLARFPHLRRLGFDNCSVLFCSGFPAAAAHARLERLELSASYPAPGPSRAAFLGFAVALLQRGRGGVLRVHRSAAQGAGRQDGQSFRAALQAAGFALRDDDDDADGLVADSDFISE